MPEGPSIAILKDETIQFKGKKVQEVSGNSKEDIQRVQGKTITDIKTWGKHYLICFKGFTIRIHLMLFGSYSINEPKPNRAIRFCMRFNNGEINFYACSVKIIEEDLDDVYDWKVDLMSKKWNAAHVRKLLKQTDEKTLACDAILDQHIFSGAGNIFKNEVLFRIKVHPKSLVSALPAKQFNDLVKATHKYAFDFYKWKKNYELKKHWQAHTKTICPRCNIPFKKAHLGKTKRRSFFCNNCQVLYKA